MKKFRLHTARILTFIVALQIINMGLFVQDFTPMVNSPYEINIINTVEEYVTEVILNQTNALPENNDHQKKDFQSFKQTIYKIINISRPPVALHANTISNSWSYIFLQNYDYRFWRDINPPPPKSAV